VKVELRTSIPGVEGAPPPEGSIVGAEKASHAVHLIPRQIEDEDIHTPRGVRVVLDSVGW
jgi:hypothetical protein